jgi:protoporphyrinogen oxidase
MAEITCHIGDKVWSMTDESIVERTVSDLSELGIINKDDVWFSKVCRAEYAYIITDLDYRCNLKTNMDYLNKINIKVIGRFAEFKYLNMDACAKHAFDYANSIREIEPLQKSVWASKQK